MDNNQQYSDKEVMETLTNFTSSLYKRGVKDGFIVGGICVGVGALATLGAQKIIEKRSKKKKSKEN